MRETGKKRVRRLLSLILDSIIRIINFYGVFVAGDKRIGVGEIIVANEITCTIAPNRAT
jgi:hypothetical protein